MLNNEIENLKESYICRVEFIKKEEPMKAVVEDERPWYILPDKDIFFFWLSLAWLVVLLFLCFGISTAIAEEKALSEQDIRAAECYKEVFEGLRDGGRGGVPQEDVFCSVIDDYIDGVMPLSECHDRLELDKRQLISTARYTIMEGDAASLYEVNNFNSFNYFALRASF